MYICMCIWISICMCMCMCICICICICIHILSPRYHLRLIPEFHPRNVFIRHNTRKAQFWRRYYTALRPDLDYYDAITTVKKYFPTLPCTVSFCVSTPKRGGWRNSKIWIMNYQCSTYSVVAITYVLDLVVNQLIPYFPLGYSPWSPNTSSMWSLDASMDIYVTKNWQRSSQS